jgi:outer membrane protein assembly factor BamB
MALRSYDTLLSSPSIAIPYAPVLSTDETKLFVASSIPIFYALDAETGVIAWSFTGEADASASAKVAPDDTSVYLTWVSSCVTLQ